MNKILIKVLLDCRVVIHAPEIVIDHDVLKAIQKRSRWVYQQLRDFCQQKELILHVDISVTKVIITSLNSIY